MTSNKAIGKKARKVKAVKGWAFLNPYGEILGIRLNSEEEIWVLAFDAYRSCKDRERLTFSQVKALVKKKGYRCIRVQITPVKTSQK
jgi:hypothetical protein